MPSRPLRPIAAQAGLLAAAFAGGWACRGLGLPAPWLTGALVASAALSLARVTPPLAPPLRDLAMLLAGLSIGGAVTPETIQAFRAYPVSLLVLVAGVAAIGGASMLVLVRLCGWPRVDALLASAPGALSTVLVVAAEIGADVGRIAVVQMFRLLVVMAVMPSVVAVGGGAPAGSGGGGPAMGPGGFALVAVLALGLAAGFRRVGLAAPLLLGGMAGSAALHGSGLVVGGVPDDVAVLGFVMVGAFAGSRFGGIDRSAALRLMPAALASFLAALAAAALFAWVASQLARVPYATALVAFAPGGLEAMSLLAFALGLDAVYVGVHHLARFLLVALAASLAGRRSRPRGAEPPA